MTTTGRLRVIAAGLAGAGCVLLAAGCGDGTTAASAKTGQAVDRACAAGN